MINDLKPGSTIKVTVTETPKTAAARHTIRRLMRMNTETQRVLKKAQRHRDTTVIIRRIRAGKLWHQRPRVPLTVRAEAGESWEMRYRPQIAHDLASVSKFVKVEAA